MAASLGVDGCKGGWIWALLSDQGAQAGFARTVTEVADLAPDQAAIFIDIPIGLPSPDQYPRACDVEAKRALGPRRGTSVFPVPCRAALESESYREGTDLNSRLTGKGFSKQLWGLQPKILEVDRALRGDPRLRDSVRETHPELVFWALNGEEPVEAPKKSRAGFQQRIELLDRAEPKARGLFERAFVEFGGFEALRDDVVDAIACALVGRATRRRTLPTDPRRDEFDLPMEMVVPA